MNNQNQTVRAFSTNGDNDLAFVREQFEKITGMLITMHGTLSEIVKTDLSPQGAISMKSAAVTALCTVQEIALDLGFQSFEGEHNEKTNIAN